MNRLSPEEMGKILAGLHSASPAVRAALLVGTDGTLLGSHGTTPTERAQLSAVSAAAVAIGRKAARNMSLGDLERIHLHGSSGSILLVSVGEKAILVMVHSNEEAPDAVLAATRSVLHNIEGLV